MDKHVTTTPRTVDLHHEEQLDWIEDLQASHVVLKLDSPLQRTAIFKPSTEHFAAKHVSNLFKEGK